MRARTWSEARISFSITQTFLRCLFMTTAHWFYNHFTLKNLQKKNTSHWARTLTCKNFIFISSLSWYVPCSLQIHSRSSSKRFAHTGSIFLPLCSRRKFKELKFDFIISLVMRSSNNWKTENIYVRTVLLPPHSHLGVNAFAILL